MSSDELRAKITAALADTFHRCGMPGCEDWPEDFAAADTIRAASAAVLPVVEQLISEAVQQERARVVAAIREAAHAISRREYADNPLMSQGIDLIHDPLTAIERGEHLPSPVPSPQEGP